MQATHTKTSISTKSAFDPSDDEGPDDIYSEDENELSRMQKDLFFSTQQQAATYVVEEQKRAIEKAKEKSRNFHLLKKECIFRWKSGPTKGKKCTAIRSKGKYCATHNKTIKDVQRRQQKKARGNVVTANRLQATVPKAPSLDDFFAPTPSTTASVTPPANDDFTASFERLFNSKPIDRKQVDRDGDTQMQEAGAGADAGAAPAGAMLTEEDINKIISDHDLAEKEEKRLAFEAEQKRKEEEEAQRLLQEIQQRQQRLNCK